MTPEIRQGSNQILFTKSSIKHGYVLTIMLPLNPINIYFNWETQTFTLDCNSPKITSDTQVIGDLFHNWQDIKYSFPFIYDSSLSVMESLEYFRQKGHHNVKQVNKHKGFILFDRTMKRKIEVIKHQSWIYNLKKYSHK